MILERAELLIKEGHEDDFAAGMAERGVPVLRALPGVRSVLFGRGIEHPDKFQLLIEWDSIDAHMAATKHPSFADFRAVMAPHTKGGSMEHYDMA
jgi:heme-degrading monooxygenase HmoA